MLSRLLAVCLIVGVSASDVTFNHVTVMGGSKPVSIQWSRHLHPHVPETTRKIYFQDGDKLPVLYSDAITNLKELEVLDLAGHEIKEIRRGAFHDLPKLQDLILDDNQLEDVTSGVFNYLSNLTRLSINRNLLKNITAGAFDKLANLSFLFLANNQLTTFDTNWFKDKPFLFLVDLNGNLIEEIPDGAFENYDNAIFLGDNKIRNLTNSMFGNGKRLQQLSLHGNEIEGWDEDLFDDVSIDSFDVSHNKIECLEGNLTEILVAKYILLSDNPWQCDCLEEIVEFEAAEEQLTIDWGTSWDECNVTGVKNSNNLQVE